jgi:hypothetical protein
MAYQCGRRCRAGQSVRHPHQVEDSGSPDAFLGCRPSSSQVRPGASGANSWSRTNCRVGHVLPLRSAEAVAPRRGHQRQRHNEPLHAIVYEPRYHAAGRAGHEIGWTAEHVPINRAAPHQALPPRKQPSATQSGNSGESSARSAASQGLAKVASVAGVCDTWRHRNRYGGLESLPRSEATWTRVDAGHPAEYPKGRR